jgi:dihydrofolate reductase
MAVRKLVEATFVSLDGVVESPERWALPLWSQANKDASLSHLNEFDTFLLGRATYEKFAATWSQIKGDPYFDRVNAMRKFVASRKLKNTTWNATLLEGDVAEEVARLKQMPGKDIIKYGTGTLDQTLIDHRLVDEFQFSIFPVVVGRGRRLFEGVDTSTLKLRLTHSKAAENGIVVHSYVMD